MRVLTKREEMGGKYNTNVGNEQCNVFAIKPEWKKETTMAA